MRIKTQSYLRTKLPKDAKNNLEIKDNHEVVQSPSTITYIQQKKQLYCDIWTSSRHKLYSEASKFPEETICIPEEVSEVLPNKDSYNSILWKMFQVI